jgi:ABC-type cobalamin/Fe3+-siderophores transport system ATPase subunit
MDKKSVIATMWQMKESIGRALVNENLSAQLVRAKRSYLTISFKLALSHSTLANLGKVKLLGPVIEQLSGYSPVRVDVSGGMISVEFPSPFPQTPSGELFATYMRGANVVVGFDNWGEPQYVNIKDRNVIGFIGIPGSGKSTAMRAILYGMMKTNPIKFVVFSEKVQEWDGWSKMQACVGVYGDVEHLNKLSQSGEPPKPTLLIIDDLQSLLSKNKNIGKLVGNIASIGRALKFYVWLGTTSWGSNETSGGFALEDSTAARIVFSAASNVAGARSTGRSGSGVSELSGGKGDALLITPSGQYRTTTGWVTDEMVRKNLPMKDKGISMSPIGQIGLIGQRSVSRRVDLPLVTPSRLLTEEEVEQVIGYCEWVKETKGVYPSLTKVIEGVYGKKNDSRYNLMKQSLGEYADVIKSNIKPPGRSKETNPVG